MKFIPPIVLALLGAALLYGGWAIYSDAPDKGPIMPIISMLGVGAAIVLIAAALAFRQPKFGGPLGAVVALVLAAALGFGATRADADVDTYKTDYERRLAEAKEDFQKEVADGRKQDTEAGWQNFLNSRVGHMHDPSPRRDTFWTLTWVHAGGAVLLLGLAGAGLAMKKK